MDTWIDTYILLSFMQSLVANQKAVLTLNSCADSFPPQPPKKKSADKKPANPRTPTLINGLTKDEMSKEQVRAEE